MIVRRPKSNIPWFISIPRSGSNWIQGMMEIYFNKPKGPILNPKKNEFSMKYRWVYWPGVKEEDLLFVAHHDQQGFDIPPSTSKEGDIFLYRNPLNSIYSNIKRDGSKGRMEYHIEEYRRTFNKWVVGKLATTIICYENMVKDPEKEFQKLVEHFNAKWDKDKFIQAYQTVTKEKLANISPGRKDIAYPEMLTDKYKNDRKNFAQKHKDEIKRKILSKENEPWLGVYFKE